MEPAFQLQTSPIYLGAITGAFRDWFEKQAYSSVLILTDENTQRHCLPYFLDQTGLRENCVQAGIPSGEAAKNLRSAEKVWQYMQEANLDRRALVVNLGGGVIGDLGGFCAATWKRGIDFVQVPTTLLAMTDAAIGGKTGIDFQGIKNIIGVFQQPEAVFVDPFFLQTLPERELRSGYAEVIKHALIGSPELKQQLLEGVTPALPEEWTRILRNSIAVKVRVVQEDPTEKGLRMLLNFGHSIGHALESYFLDSEVPLTHGEAVYIGMICEAHLSGNQELEQAVWSLGHTLFPYHNIPPTAFPSIRERMLQDKKNSSGTVRMAVPDETPFSLKMIEPAPREIDRSLEFFNSLGSR